MKHVYLVRHGQTEANKAVTFQGPDEPLSEVGRQQALRLAERVQNLDFEKMIVSDYLRTRETAEIIADVKTVETELSPLFREETYPSAWLGTPENDERGNQFFNDLIDFADDETWRVEDAENAFDIHERITQALETLRQDSVENILVVTHGNFLKQLVSYVLLNGHCSPKEMAALKRALKTTNTGISVITYEDRWRLLTWNDHAHFAE